MKDSSELMADFAEFETTYWFYVARMNILRKLFEQYIKPEDLVLNIGCGPGATSKLAAEFGEVISMDYSLDALRFSSERGLSLLSRADCVSLPMRDKSCNLALCLDVMEHIEDDRAFADELLRVLVPGGRLLLTVPAGMWQWTRRDDVFGHFRRYSSVSLNRVLAGAGFRLLHTTHFNSLLLPLNVIDVLIDRFRKKVDDGNCYPQFNPVLNGILRSVLSFEKYIIPRPGFPFGRSILAIAVRD